MDLPSDSYTVPSGAFVSAHSSLPPLHRSTSLASFQFEEVGEPEPWHRQLGSMSIAGVRFHVDAIAVERSPSDGDFQEAVADDLRISFALAAEGLGTDTGFQTVRLGGSDGRDHEYVLFIYPCDG